MDVNFDRPQYVGTASQKNQASNSGFGWFQTGILLQIIHFHQSNSNSVVHTTHNRSVVSWLQRRDDCRLAWLSRSTPAVLDRANLVAGDDPADYRSLPVVVRGN